jgi:hypothetical protein
MMYLTVSLGQVEMMFILATLLLFIAFVQKIKPTFSITYHYNKPSYVKAKLVSKVLTSGSLYICGLYFYFTGQTTDSWITFWALWIPLILYHVFIRGLTKLFDDREKLPSELS